MKTIIAFMALACCSLVTLADNAKPTFYTGADLSYVNEMEDCGGSYFDRGKKKDPFDIFAAYGTDIVRVRLWHNATWTKYCCM